MGSGKTTLGKRIAKLTGYKFIDMDALIEKKEGLTISEIFNLKGEQWFRDKETQVLSTFLPESNLVIATGGGAPCFNSNMALMNRIGITVYLKPDVNGLAARLEHTKDNRPLIAKLDHEELIAHINNKLTEREPFYNQAKCTIKGNNIQAEQIVRLVFGEDVPL